MNNQPRVPRPTIHIVDDNSLERDVICRLVASMEARTQTFHSAEEFLDYYDDQPGCVVTDHRLAGQTGLELLEDLQRRKSTIPVIIATAHARTALTVRAMQAGAVMVFDKPYSEDEMWQAIRKALALDAEQRQQQRSEEELRRRFAMLSEKERQVLQRVVAGKPNKAMASELEVSLRTIENRRRSIFTKLRVNSVAELVTMVLRFDDAQTPQRTRIGAPHVFHRES